MLEYIKGKIIHLGDEYVIIENNGIGYRIMTSMNTISNINPEATDILLYTHIIMREEDILLYGFDSVDEMDPFKLLITVSKVGPKLACAILSCLNTSRLKMAILSNDIALLCKCSGVGKKTAERIILELKDKIDENSINYGDIKLNNINSVLEEVTEACISLGYNRYEIRNALEQLDLENLEIEEIIKLVLRKLAN